MCLNRGRASSSPLAGRGVRGWPALALHPDACADLSAKLQLIFNAWGFVSDAAQGWRLIKGKADSELIKPLIRKSLRVQTRAPSIPGKQQLGVSLQFSSASACVWSDSVAQRHRDASRDAPLGLTQSSIPGASITGGMESRPRKNRGWGLTGENIFPWKVIPLPRGGKAFADFCRFLQTSADFCRLLQIFALTGNFCCVLLAACKLGECWQHGTAWQWPLT